MGELIRGIAGDLDPMISPTEGSRNTQAKKKQNAKYLISI